MHHTSMCGMAGPPCLRHLLSISFSLQHRFTFVQSPSVRTFSTRLTQAYSLARSLSTLFFNQNLFMQPEPTAVSQHTFPVDSSPIDPSSTQHGHDLDDAQVSDFLEREDIRDSADVSSMSPRDELPGASLKEVYGRFTPPSADRVIQHENALSSLNQTADAAFRLLAINGHVQTSFETLPNGESPLTRDIVLFDNCNLQRSSPIFYRIYPHKPCLL